MLKEHAGGDLRLLWGTNQAEFRENLTLGALCKKQLTDLVLIGEDTNVVGIDNHLGDDVNIVFLNLYGLSRYASD